MLSPTEPSTLKDHFHQALAKLEASLTEDDAELLDRSKAKPEAFLFGHAGVSLSVIGMGGPPGPPPVAKQESTVQVTACIAKLLVFEREFGIQDELEIPNSDMWLAILALLMKVDSEDRVNPRAPEILGGAFNAVTTTVQMFDVRSRGPGEATRDDRYRDAFRVLRADVAEFFGNIMLLFAENPYNYDRLSVWSQFSRVQTSMEGAEAQPEPLTHLHALAADRQALLTPSELDHTHGRQEDGALQPASPGTGLNDIDRAFIQEAMADLDGDALMDSSA